MTRPLAAFLAGLVPALAFGWLGFPRLLHVAAEQPLQFSHQVHTSEATGLGCDDCHGFRSDGELAGIPSAASCAGCHAEPIGDSTEERRLVEEFVAPCREIPWLAYSRQPDHVYFPHFAHVTSAGLACEDCHGPHGASASLAAVEIDRITGYARGQIRMGECEECHRESGRGTLACIGCHR
jgi:hypothetical protein